MSGAFIRITVTIKIWEDRFGLLLLVSQNLGSMASLLNGLDFSSLVVRCIQNRLVLLVMFKNVKRLGSFSCCFVNKAHDYGRGTLTNLSLIILRFKHFSLDELMSFGCFKEFAMLESFRPRRMIWTIRPQFQVVSQITLSKHAALT